MDFSAAQQDMRSAYVNGGVGFWFRVWSGSLPDW